MYASTSHSRIGTNHGSTKEERVQIKDHLSECIAKLTKLQGEVDRAHSAYLEVHNRLETQSRYIEDHRALMAPIRHLPVDVLQQIFEHCLPTDHNSIMSCHEPPMLLTQICSSWRFIAHSTASLWASIHIPIPNNGYFHDPQNSSSARLQAFQERIARVKEWLGRSGACPLKISIFDLAVQNIMDMMLEEAYREMLDLLISFSHRWADMDIQLPPNRLARVISMSEGSVPMLRSISVSGFFPSSPHPTNDIQSWKNSALLRAPRLRKIPYTSHDTNEDFTAFPLQWSSLTAITLNIHLAWHVDSITDYSKFRLLLRSCPLLVSFTLDAMSHSVANPQAFVAIPAISLPHLQKLSVRCNIEELSLLFITLDVPSLREIEFYSSPSVSPRVDVFASRLMLWLSKIDPTLQKLTTDPSIFSKAKFIRTLRSCPRVTTLCLKHFSHQRIYHDMPPPRRHPPTDEGDFTGYHVDDQLLYDFIGHDDKVSALLPNLSNFECFANGNISDVAIIDFVKAKRSRVLPGVATLNHLAIRLSPRRQTKVMVEELRPFVEDGMSCHLCYGRDQDLPQPNFSASSGIIRGPEFDEAIPMGAGQWKLLLA